MKRIAKHIGLVLLCAGVLMGCSQVEKTEEQKAATDEAAKDLHSYANADSIKVTNVDLDWDVDFSRKTISGSAVLSFERVAQADKIVLDTRDLKIEKTETSADGGENYTDAKFTLGEPDKFLGSSLTVDLPADADRVKVTYSTSPEASGLQWLTPQQTAGKKKPFMFSQAQAIHARSFVPLQDSPGIRVTYSATVRVPKGLLAVMSAGGNSQDAEREGEYKFKMEKAIPTYLIAIGVGDLEFRSLGKRAGVYAEPSVIEKAAKEFEDTEKMMVATESIYGKYEWDRYDLLVLPPSFPLGGMENPMLTFATPTILAGDKSLVSLVAHELAHSWSGNLVSNSTWRDFWLNEGFTTYLTYRITEAVYGKKQSEMEATLSKKGLEDSIKEMDKRDQILHVDLKDRDPDDGFTSIPYEKGALFLRFLEEKYGRERFDKFLKGYFKEYAFKSISTAEFVNYLNKNLLSENPVRVKPDEVEEWIYKPGLPESAPKPKSEALDEIDSTTKKYLDGAVAVADIKTDGWSTQEWLRFLRNMPEDLGEEKMAELDKTFEFTKAGNSEIAFQWLIMSIRQKYKPADRTLEEFLTSVGRRKFVQPLFAELVKTPEGKTRAKEIYKKARSGYHPITQTSVDKGLEEKPAGG